MVSADGSFARVCDPAGGVGEHAAANQGQVYVWVSCGRGVESGCGQGGVVGGVEYQPGEGLPVGSVVAAVADGERGAVGLGEVMAGWNNGFEGHLAVVHQTDAETLAEQFGFRGVELGCCLDQRSRVVRVTVQVEHVVDVFVEGGGSG